MNKETKNVVWTGAFFGVLAIIMSYVAYTTNTKSLELKDELESVATQIGQLKKKANDKVLEEREKTKLELAAAVREYVKILPSAALVTPDSIRKNFSQYAQQANIEVLEVAKRAGRAAPRRGRRRRGKKKAAKDFEKLEFSLRIRGSLENLARFMNSIETDEKFFQIEKFNLKPKEVDDQAGVLNSELVVTTFQYVVKKGK